MVYIDIHTHTYYSHNDVITVQNVFPSRPGELDNNAYHTIGLHPWHIENSDIETELEWISDNALRDDVIAIGETGLDKTIACPLEKQTDVFLRQLEIAADARKPVILHCVRAYSEMMAYRKKFGTKIPWIFHWFNADSQTAEQLVRKNSFLSFGHMLFNERSKAYNTFAGLDVSKVFFETDDAGYSIYEVYERAAGIKKMDSGDLARIISSNFAQCFNL